MSRLGLILPLAALLLLFSCGPADPDNDESEEPQISFEAVSVPQFGGGDERGLWERASADEWRTNDALEPAVALHLEEDFEDVYVRMTVTVGQGQEAGIILNYSDGSYYFAGLGSFQSRYAIGRQDADQRAPRELAAYGLDHDIEPHLPVTLEVTLRFQGPGAHILLEADGERVLEAADPRPLEPGGSVGLRTWRTRATFKLEDGPGRPGPVEPN